MQLRFFVHKPPAHVFSCLTDMTKFAAVHPLIYKTENTGTNRFLIYERLKLLGIPQQFTYPAEVDANEEAGIIVFNAVVKKIVHIRLEMRLVAENGGTRIEEDAQFSSWLPVHPVLRFIFRKYHRKLFENIGQA